MVGCTISSGTTTYQNKGVVDRTITKSCGTIACHPAFPVLCTGREIMMYFRCLFHLEDYSPHGCHALYRGFNEHVVKVTRGITRLPVVSCDGKQFCMCN